MNGFLLPGVTYGIFGLLSFLSIAFSIWMAVDAVRRGQNYFWIWIILFFQPFGALIYFFTEFRMPRGALRLSRVSPAELARAESEAKRFDNAAVWFRYAELLKEKGRTREAGEAAARAVGFGEKDPKPAYLLAQVRYEERRLEEAEEILGRLVAADPNLDSGGALALYSRVLHGRGRKAEALAAARRLASISARAEHLYWLAGLEEESGDGEEARRTLTRLVDEAQYVPDYLKRSVKPWVNRARKDLERMRG